MTTLKEWADGLLDFLPDGTEADPVVFSASLLPPVPGMLECAELVIKRGFHDYDTWRVDYPQWSGSKETYAQLGLLILAALVHRQASTRVRLTSPHTEIVALVIQQPPLVDHQTGLELVPSSLHYSAEPVERHPWASSFLDVYDLPWFKLTNTADDDAISDAQRAQRDCIHGFGSSLASARFARLLLDLSRPSNQTVEVALECEAGFRGVAPASAEVRLWLPGAIYWYDPAVGL